jgi:hypothetical protein
MMNRICHNVVFNHDILIHSKDEEEHEKHTRMVLKKLNWDTCGMKIVEKGLDQIFFSLGRAIIEGGTCAMD